ncbi:hypothetical protein OR571_19550 [Psychrobacillus sp. NEAU-3TGS]|uniref:hypothetical protein n=1 Tax=Psychrobacillus sp. NEAU-3TGS TaxID=2995412 RepID=UPI00249733FF|nr:hypothetical protein [Psychrobacillus sp. NEAU-3TGS]MDI2589234.1 hypothetical protein [Psychrobacillus sp. NEAU-3TGS]
MTSIILVILFLLQLISFYFIALLNAKLTKFNNMEQKQEQILAEIEDSFSAYIAEIKDENDRLLRELNHTDRVVAATTEQVEEKEDTIETTPVFEVPKAFVSKQLAANSYLKTASVTEKKEPVTIKEKVFFMLTRGKASMKLPKSYKLAKQK